jgi:hypothetical protein
MLNRVRSVCPWEKERERVRTLLEETEGSIHLARIGTDERTYPLQLMTVMMMMRVICKEMLY